MNITISVKICAVLKKNKQGLKRIIFALLLLSLVCFFDYDVHLVDRKDQGGFILMGFRGVVGKKGRTKAIK